jgi:hypothetical protein
MLTAMHGDAQLVPSRVYSAVLGKLLVVALILVPLAAMLFLEPRHRSGKTATPSSEAAPAARSAVKDPLAIPSFAKRIDR